MLKKMSIVFWVSTLAMALAVGAAADQAGDEALPKALFPESSWNFDPVLEGTDVIHDFIVKNQGLAPLEILGVKTS